MNTTCYTIISKDRQLLEWCVNNARERAGIDSNWLLVHWVNPEMSEYQVENIQEAARNLNMQYVVHSADQVSDYPNRTAWFIKNLYAAWNLGYEHSDTKYVARMGSDQFFSRDWLKWLVTASEMRHAGTFHSWTVESTAAQKSRHDIRDWGCTYDTFDRPAFDLYATNLIHQYSSRVLLNAGECKLFYHHPARGIQSRPDGCTWFQTKELWEQYGPMEDTINDEHVTGDVAYMDRLSDAGIPAYLVPPSVTYHLVRGESRDEYK